MRSERSPDFWASFTRARTVVTIREHRHEHEHHEDAHRDASRLVRRRSRRAARSSTARIPPVLAARSAGTQRVAATVPYLACPLVLPQTGCVAAGAPHDP